MANATSDAVPKRSIRAALAILIGEASKGLDDVAAGRVKPARETLLKLKHRVAARNAASTRAKAAAFK